MKKIEYTPDAADKLREIKKYIVQQYGEESSKRVIQTITNAIRGLCEYEKKGPEVSKMFEIDTEYRYLFVSQMYVFYKIEDKYIRIINQYHEKEDFMQKLFGIDTTLQDTIDFLQE
ncbi:MAG: type II toxin-antitoxin system RelE/ParE family toxin [Lachnospiraceae bacterium]|nr:type II toxin-antitoxin system RelE/ParE family toxin [Lachnospiraceae bacterium]MBR1568964.1 type II toxin-antitoxin system RelE/ParE family toxin [Lachnospiraceae bacterium]